jgi:hypothetical protein
MDFFEAATRNILSSSSIETRPCDKPCCTEFIPSSVISAAGCELSWLFSQESVAESGFDEYSIGSVR